MNSDFSERQYEMMLNIELSTGLGSAAAPVMPVVPNSHEESKRGWDALFRLGQGYWYFLQYKIVTLGSRRTSWNMKFWDLHGGPYFRFDLHADSNQECRQHRLLTELRSTQPGVYYCVPTFVKEAEFWDRASTGAVFDGSRLIDLADVPLHDRWGRHQISFDEAGLVQVWSEPGKQSRGDRSPGIRRRSANRREMTNVDVFALFSDASRVAARSVASRLGSNALDSWVRARVPEEAVDVVRRNLGAQEDLRSDLAPALPGPDLLATTARVLQFDFGLTWIVEPA